MACAVRACRRSGRRFAACTRRDRPRATDKRRLDEVVVAIDGANHRLRRAMDADGDVLDIPARPRRDAKAARRFLKRPIARFGEPRVVVTDRRRSDTKPIGDLAPNAGHRAHKG